MVAQHGCLENDYNLRKSDLFPFIFSDARSVKKLLPRQLVNNVRWETVIQNLMKYKSEDLWPRLIECGPGNSLTAITKQINGKMGKRSSIVPA